MNKPKTDKENREELKEMGESMQRTIREAHGYAPHLSWFLDYLDAAYRLRETEISQLRVDLEYVRQHTLYFNFSDDALEGTYEANKGNVAGEAALVQLTVRKALARLNRGCA